MEELDWENNYSCNDNNQNVTEVSNPDVMFSFVIDCRMFVFHCYPWRVIYTYLTF